MMGGGAIGRGERTESGGVRDFPWMSKKGNSRAATDGVEEEDDDRKVRGREGGWESGHGECGPGRREGGEDDGGLGEEDTMDDDPRVSEGEGDGRHVLAVATSPHTSTAKDHEDGEFIRGFVEHLQTHVGGKRSAKTAPPDCPLHRKVLVLPQSRGSKGTPTARCRTRADVSRPSFGFHGVQWHPAPSRCP